MSDFEFQYDENDELSLEGAVFQALGAASTCWETLSGTGEFDSTRARAIGDELLVFFHAWVATHRPNDPAMPYRIQLDHPAVARLGRAVRHAIESPDAGTVFEPWELADLGTLADGITATSAEAERKRTNAD